MYIYICILDIPCVQICVYNIYICFMYNILEYILSIYNIYISIGYIHQKLYILYIYYILYTIIYILYFILYTIYTKDSGLGRLEANTHNP